MIRIPLPPALLPSPAPPRRWPPMPERMLTVAEVAERLGTTERFPAG